MAKKTKKRGCFCTKPQSIGRLLEVDLFKEIQLLDVEDDDILDLNALSEVGKRVFILFAAADKLMVQLEDDDAKNKVFEVVIQQCQVWVHG